MQHINLIPETNIPLKEGNILIAEPLLIDKNFTRNVIYLCSYNLDGAFGFSLNKKLIMPIGEILPDLENSNFPVYIGGPVQSNVLNIIHSYPKLLGGNFISPNIYFGADINVLKKQIKLGKIAEEKIKFFVGYCGWDPLQLEQEIEEKTWIIAPSNSQLIFNTLT